MLSAEEYGDLRTSSYPVKFNPLTGEPWPLTAHPAYVNQFRYSLTVQRLPVDELKAKGVFFPWLYNPWTGAARSPEDIEANPFGRMGDGAMCGFDRNDRTTQEMSLDFNDPRFDEIREERRRIPDGKYLPALDGSIQPATVSPSLQSLSESEIAFVDYYKPEKHNVPWHATVNVTPSDYRTLLYRGVDTADCRFTIVKRWVSKGEVVLEAEVLSLGSSMVRNAMLDELNSLLEAKRFWEHHARELARIGKEYTMRAADEIFPPLE